MLDETMLPQRGAALILVLWTFVVLSVLAGEFARAMRRDAISTATFKQETVAHYVAIAGINEVVLALQSYRAAGEDGLGDEEADDATDEETDGDSTAEDQGKGKKGKDGTASEEPPERGEIATLLQGDGSWVEAAFDGQPYEVRVMDESGKISLNQVEGECLNQILLNLGYEELVADTVTDSILDWRDEDDLHRINGAEDQYYQSLPRPYRCKNGPFEALQELLLVRGVTHDMFYGSKDVPDGSNDVPDGSKDVPDGSNDVPDGSDDVRGLRDIFSVFNDTPRVNLRSMSPAVMMAIGGVDPDEATDITSRRRPGQHDDAGEELHDLLADSCVGTRSGTPVVMTIESRVKDEQGRVLSQVGAVARIPPRGDGFRFLRWYDVVFAEKG